MELKESIRNLIYENSEGVYEIGSVKFVDSLDIESLVINIIELIKEGDYEITT